MATNPYSSPESESDPEEPKEDTQRNLNVWRRLKIIGPGLLAGALFSAVCAATQMPTAWGFSQRLEAFGLIMAGPLSTILLEHYNPLLSNWIFMGFLGIPLISLHPLHPSILTACMSIIGFVFWFVAGFVVLICAVWGA